MRTKYEEKTYESYFNSELSQKADIYFPIGQVQEGNFAFDAAYFIRNKKYLNISCFIVTLLCKVLNN